MSTYYVTPSSNLQAATAGLVSGDTLIFQPGQYNVSSTINLVSGVSYVGQPGAVLNSASSSNIMQGVGVSNISITGLTFNGGPNVSDGAHGAIFLVDAETASIIGNTFTNINADAAVLFYQSDNVTIDNNTASNLREFVSGINNNGSHGNIFISGNTATTISRIAVEVQGSYNNLQVDNNTISGDPNEAISVVAGQNSSAVSIIGNVLSNGLTAIEVSDRGATVTNNVVTNFTGGLSIAAAPQSDFYNNSFTGVTIPLGEDGGYTGQQWVGTNTINGVATTGWAGHPNSPDSPPPATTPPPAATSPTPAVAATAVTPTPTPTPTATPASSTGTVTVGSGPDTIALTMAEDAFQGDAQFVVLVNGAQVGGTQTVTAQQGLGQSQVFDIEGAFNSGGDAVQIDFLNDLYGGSPTADRNLYLLGASYSGTSNQAVAAPAAQDALLSSGAFNFTVNTAVPGPTIIGSGPDLLQLTLGERAFAGDAQFAVSVDGLLVGGLQTVTAIAAAGESQVFDVMGSFGAGSHNVSIVMTDPNGYAGYPLAGRSLYVEGASLDGSPAAGLANTTLSLTTATPDSFSVTDTQTPPVVLGAGPDTLALFMAEDAYLGNAQFTISVDGQQVGGTQTTGELHGSGQAQEFDILGTFAPGSHNVSVDFLNDASAAPYNAGQDRNLYIDAASINGNTIGGGQIALDNTGSRGFSFNTPNAAGPMTVGGAGPDTLALNVSEDFYQGNAQFTVSVDGTQVGGVQTASAIHGNGQSQMFDLFGSFSGSHSVTVNFVNDAYGTPFAADVDRNLYVGGASVDGSAISNSNLSLLAGGPQSFSFTH